MTKLLTKQATVSPFLLANMRQIAFAILGVNRRYVVPHHNPPATDTEILDSLDLSKASGVPYNTTKKQAILDNGAQIWVDSLRITYGDWNQLSEPPVTKIIRKCDETLPLSKCPELIDGCVVSFGKERNIASFPMAPLLAWKRALLCATEFEISNWRHTFCKVGSGKMALPEMFAQLQREAGPDASYAAFDITGMEYSLHPAWFQLCAVYRAAQSAVPQCDEEWFLAFYDQFVCRNLVVCPCGNVYRKSGNNTSGFPGTVNDNSLISHALCVATLAVIVYGLDVNQGTALQSKDFIPIVQSLSGLCVGDDLLCAFSQPPHFWLEFAAVANTVSSLQLKLECAPSRQPYGQPFLSNTVPRANTAAFSVRPLKILAGLYGTNADPKLWPQIILSALMDFYNMPEYFAHVEALALYLLQLGFPIVLLKPFEIENILSQL